MKRLLRKLRPASRVPIPVVLYTRPGCHLCEDARALLEHVAGPGAVTIEEVDIRTDPNLVRSYDLRIPVIRIGETVELSAPIREDALRRALGQAKRT